MLNLISNTFIFLSVILLVLCCVLDEKIVLTARLIFGNNLQMSSTLVQLILGWLTVIEIYE